MTSTSELLGWGSAGFIVGQLAISLGYPGMLHMLVRYMTVRDDRDAARAGAITAVWSIVVLVGSTSLVAYLDMKRIYSFVLSARGGGRRSAFSPVVIPGLHWKYELVPAFLLSFAAGIAVSFLTANRIGREEK